MEKNELLYKKKTAFEKSEKPLDALQEACAYATGYKAFLDASKTEREAVTTAIAMAEKEGFKELAGRVADGRSKLEQVNNTAQKEQRQKDDAEADDHIAQGFADRDA